MSKNRNSLRSLALKCAGVLAVTLLATARPAAAQVPAGTAFTYQAELSEAGALVDETCDFEFSLWDDSATPPGVQVGSTLSQTIAVADGRFTTSLDFGVAKFAGNATWLEIAVCCAPPCAPTTLTTRQELKPAPYALFALDGNAGPIGPQGPQGIEGPIGPQGAPGDSHWLINGSSTYYNDGNVGIGTSSPSIKLHVAGDLRVEGFHNSTGFRAELQGRAGRGTSVTPLPVTSGDTLLTIRGTGYDNSTFGTAAFIHMGATEDWTPTAHGSRITFHTTPNGSTVTGGVPKMSLDGDGDFEVDFNTLFVNATDNRVGIGTTFPSEKLSVSGNISVTGTVDGVDIAAHAGNASAHHVKPTSLPPSGSAGGDLSGSYPNPSVLNDSHTHANGTVSDNISIDNGRLWAPAGSGSVGIGTTAPVSTLQIKGGNLTFEDTLDTVRRIRHSWDFYFEKDIDDDNAGVLGAWTRFFEHEAGLFIEQMRIEGGDEAPIKGDGSFTSNGLDYAEAFKVLEQESDLEAGDVVSLALGQWEYARRTAQRYDAHIIGVVSTQPSFLAGMSFDAEDAADPAIAQQRDEARARGDDEEARALTVQLMARVEEIYRPIALAGRVPCKVDGQYGAIHAGDRITSSATPGHAMKQTESGPSIGVALEDWTAGGTGKIIVLIQPGWFGVGVARTADAVPGDAAGIARELAKLRSQMGEMQQQLATLTAEVGKK